jgi:hypothetical protein
MVIFFNNTTQNGMYNFKISRPNVVLFRQDITIVTYPLIQGA